MKMETKDQKCEKSSDLHSWLSGTSSSSSFFQLWFHKGSLQNNMEHLYSLCHYSLCPEEGRYSLFIWETVAPHNFLPVNQLQDIKTVSLKNRKLVDI